MTAADPVFGPPAAVQPLPVTAQLECPRCAVRWTGSAPCWVCGDPGADPVTLMPRRAAQPLQLVTSYTAVP